MVSVQLQTQTSLPPSARTSVSDKTSMATDGADATRRSRRGGNTGGGLSRDETALGVLRQCVLEGGWKPVRDPDNVMARIWVKKDGGGTRRDGGECLARAGARWRGDGTARRRSDRPPASVPSRRGSQSTAWIGSRKVGGTWALAFRTSPRNRWSGSSHRRTCVRGRRVHCQEVRRVLVRDDWIRRVQKALHAVLDSHLLN